MINFIDMMQYIVMGGAALLFVAVPLSVVGTLMQKHKEAQSKREMMELWMHTQNMANMTQSMKNAGVDPNLAMFQAMPASSDYKKKSFNLITTLLGVNALLFVGLIFAIIF
ncbi:hypothetical protein JK635_07815 [Neobacillus sp. YIM B02564]|uniref:DUF3899 domain-containing protein n=1 Tax=Neobacillus paridis TaxID=2803862 RepID=A0ABS1TLC3_9BACI|nr:hypothetical protein [Neobacillus paridis]MBL4952116.1 hypothetical protein [Neobacillus paridis]